MYIIMENTKNQTGEPTAKKMAKENIVFVRRVAYGEEDTLEENREYQIDGKGPVGTIQEYIDAGLTPVIEEVN